MNQSELQYISTWKCHRETPCHYLKKCHFFLLQNWRTGGQNRSFLEGWSQWEGGGGREMVKEGEYGANTVYTWVKMEK
jgi:hypothetical protein